jgi:phasin family protein
MAATAQFPDFTAFFSEFKFPYADAERMFAMQRRNFEALSAANQVVTEGVRAVMRRQAEITQRSIEKALDTAKDGWANPNPETAANRSASAAKEGFETILASTSELTELAAKSGREAIDLLSQRFMQCMEEATSCTAGSKSKKSA